VKELSEKLTLNYLTYIFASIRLKDEGMDATPEGINAVNRARAEVSMADEFIRTGLKNHRLNRIPVESDPDADCR